MLTQTPLCNFGEAAIDFTLTGVDNRQWNLADCRGKNGLLIMFICNHCPYVKSIQEKIIRDAKAMQLFGINAVAIMANDARQYPEDSFENMQRIARQYHYPFPYLWDETQTVAKAYDAVCTPDFFGYNKDLKLQYRGRLDESRTENIVGAKRELFEAMQQISQTGQGPKTQIASLGCSIKWRS